MIKEIPVEKHAIEITKAIFREHLPEDLKHHRFISRETLINEKESFEKVKGVILWGYPKGNQRWVPKLLADKKTLQRIVSILSDPETGLDELFSLVENKAIPNLGSVTLSKLAYFFELKSGDQKALILDKRIMAACRKWEELADLRFAQSNSFTKEEYKKYLERMYVIANEIRATAAQLEFFLFKMGGTFFCGDVTPNQAKKPAVVEW